jgi:hypothetical protein
MITSAEKLEEAKQLTRKKAGRPRGKAAVATRLDWASPALLEELEELTRCGLTDGQVAHCLNVSPPTLQKHKLESEEVSNALQRGRSRGIQRVANRLFEDALDGNTTAQKFYLQAVGAWRVTDQATVGSSADAAFEQVEREMSAISAENKKLIEVAAKEGAAALKNLDQGAVN